jgi:Rrf2 family protein
MRRARASRLGPSPTWPLPARRSNGPFVDNDPVRVSAKADYAVRATIELAAGHDSGPIKGDQIAEAQDIPLRFMENILGDLRHHGLVESRRGAEGGYWLSRPPDEITVGEVMRAAEGPLAHVRGERPDELEYRGAAEPLREVWVALRNNVRGILDNVTLADVIADRIPRGVKELGKKPDLRAY